MASPITDLSSLSKRDLLRHICQSISDIKWRVTVIEAAITEVFAEELANPSTSFTPSTLVDITDVSDEKIITDAKPAEAGPTPPTTGEPEAAKQLHSTKDTSEDSTSKIQQKDANDGKPQRPGLKLKCDSFLDSPIDQGTDVGKKEIALKWLPSATLPFRHKFMGSEYRSSRLTPGQPTSDIDFTKVTANAQTVTGAAADYLDLETCSNEETKHLQWSGDIKETVTATGIDKLLPIQRQVYDGVMSGKFKTLWVNCPPSSGKTTAAIVVSLETAAAVRNAIGPPRKVKLNDPARPTVIFLSPTSALGADVLETLRTFIEHGVGHIKDIRAIGCWNGLELLAGGKCVATDVKDRTDSRSVDIWVCCPGKLGVMLREGRVTLDDCPLIVFDEGHVSLDAKLIKGNNISAMDCILSALHEAAENATNISGLRGGPKAVVISPAVDKSLLSSITKNVLRDPAAEALVITKLGALTAVNVMFRWHRVVHTTVEGAAQDRTEELLAVIKTDQALAPDHTYLIICGTKEDTRAVFRALQDEGTWARSSVVRADGSMKFNESNWAIRRFQLGAGGCRFLCVTQELAIRGMNFKNLPVGILYSIGQVPTGETIDTWLTAAARVGRANHCGDFHTLIDLKVQKDYDLLESAVTYFDTPGVDSEEKLRAGDIEDWMTEEVEKRKAHKAGSEERSGPVPKGKRVKRRVRRAVG